MKFMLNGAVTLGTEDGANVEIHQLVGDENIYIFGDSSETVVNRYKQGNYNPKDYYLKDKNIKEAVVLLQEKNCFQLESKKILNVLKMNF